MCFHSALTSVPVNSGAATSLQSPSIAFAIVITITTKCLPPKRCNRPKHA